MTALHSITAYESDPDCARCEGDGLVCEAHPDQPWGTGTHDCGAPGMPCTCNRWPCGDVGARCRCGFNTEDEPPPGEIDRRMAERGYA